MTVTVRQAKHGRWGETRRNWVVTTEDTSWTHVTICGTPDETRTFNMCETTIRTYTCTNFTDAIRIANDLANGWAIDPNRIIALSENRVKNNG
jgi:hypothetical protein